MRRLLTFAAAAVPLVLCLRATTLERLSLDEMTEKSTAIVRGRVAGSRAATHGPVIYTHYTVQVLERWKGPEAGQVDVAIAGGSVQGLTQTFAGAPQLTAGEEYVFFLWTGKSGINHVIGFSQGVFTLKPDGQGGTTAVRAASSEAMLDPKTGRVMSDEPVSMRLSDLRARVAGTLALVRGK